VWLGWHTYIWTGSETKEKWTKRQKDRLHILYDKVSTSCVMEATLISHQPQYLGKSKSNCSMWLHSELHIHALAKDHRMKQKCLGELYSMQSLTTSLNYFSNKVIDEGKDLRTSRPHYMQQQNDINAKAGSWPLNKRSIECHSCKSKVWARRASNEQL
jgi:hypothetical protein